MISTTTMLPFLDEDEVRSQIDADEARRLVERALLEGFDPSTDLERQHVEVGQGHLLLMPSVLGDLVGVKIASVAPGNPGRGLPRIQAIYLLLDAATLTPRALIEGSVLTALRTPATTAVACDRLASPEASRLVVFGSGPQAIEHVAAMARIRPLADIRLIGRNPERAHPALDKLRALNLRVNLGTPEDVKKADIVVCATSASQPLFDHAWIQDGSCVAAMGSHEPSHRELPGALIGRSFVVVEDRETALREAGDIVQAIAEGEAMADNMHGLAALTRGEVTRATDRPNVFKGTGMSWQDLAVVSGLKVL